MTVLAAGCGSAVEADDDGSTGSSGEVASTSEGSSTGSDTTPVPGSSTSTSTGTTDAPGTTTTGEPGTTSAMTSSSSGGSSTSGAESSSSGGDTTTGVLPGDDFYASLHAVIAPDLPFQFVGSIEADDASITMSLTPLSLDVGSVDTPREELPPPLELSGTVDVDGTFTIVAPDVELSGAANPITGSDIVVDITIEGSFVDDLVCAQVSGMVTVPASIDLQGSSFGAMPLPAGDLPLPDDIDCP